MPIRRALVAGLLSAALAGLTTPGRGQTAADAPKEETFSTVDGVELRGVFYRATNPKQAAGNTPIVLVLHSYRGGPFASAPKEAVAKADFEKEEAAWDNACKLIQSKGVHAFRFDFRGHGKSTRLAAKDFYDTTNPAVTPWGKINKDFTKLPRDAKGAAIATYATQTTLEAADFEPKYYPMLVQDLAAARAHLDKKNDAGEVNTSSIYLLGANDAVNLGLFWVLTEWNRERVWSDVFTPAWPRIFPRRPRQPGDDYAGKDVRGAIWLSPAPSPGNSLSHGALQGLVFTEPAIDIRMETQMAFMYGKNEERAGAKSEDVRRSLTDTVLRVDPRNISADVKPGAKQPERKFVGPTGKQIPNPKITFYKSIPTKLWGTNLLGNNLGTEEDLANFFKEVEEYRLGRGRVERKWKNPLYVDVQMYGFCK
jgi:pimeloyl-ACP methyl ester carboxylesterase